MRNTTKLKHLLRLYTVFIDMDDEERLELTLTDKRTHHSHRFTDKSYSIVIGKAFSFMLKELKKSGSPEF